MSPRTIADLDQFITRPANLDPDTCCGCGCIADPDGLCDECAAKREEYGAHHPDCRCGTDAQRFGCCWYLATNARMAARGLR